MIHLDTHLVIWLVAELHERIPAKLRRRIETEPVAISPMVRLELALLREIDRISASPAEILDELRRVLSLQYDGTGLAEVIAIAESEAMAFTRDPFDRIIGAQAIAADAVLATKDRTLQKNLDIAIWD